VADLLHMVNGRSPSPSIGWTAWLIETSSHRRTGVLGRLDRGQWYRVSGAAHSLECQESSGRNSDRSPHPLCRGVVLASDEVR